MIFTSATYKPPLLVFFYLRHDPHAPRFCLLLQQHTGTAYLATTTTTTTAAGATTTKS